MKKRTVHDSLASSMQASADTPNSSIPDTEDMESLPSKIQPLNDYDFLSDASVAKDITEVISKIHELFPEPANGDENIALVKLVHDIPLELWAEYAMTYGLEDWLVIPVKQNIASTLSALIDFQGTLSKQRYTDALTGIGNRGYFNKCLEHEFNRSVRSGDDLALIIFDLDNFKIINDTYGHPCGDMVLAEFAKMLTSSTRPYDYVARIGGEEFAVVLPNTGVFTGNALGNRIRKKLHKMIFQWEGAEFCMTVSGGVASLNTIKDTSIDTLFQDADTALYQAKNKGRDKIVIAHARRKMQDNPTLVHADEKRFLFNS